jgi:hypothetical protein
VPVAEIARDAELEAQLSARMQIARSELGMSERYA